MGLETLDILAVGYNSRTLERLHDWPFLLHDFLYALHDLASSINVERTLRLV